MFFCEKCSYLYDITKTIKIRQNGGKKEKKLNNLFEKFSTGQEIMKQDLSKLSGADVTDDEKFDELNKKTQKKLIAAIKNIDKTFFDDEKNLKASENVSAFFICKYCENNKPIRPGTLIYSKKYSSELPAEEEDYTFAIYDNTLFRTRNYICPNKKCESHKNDDVREAVITKNSNYQVVYVCTSCSTHWINSL